MRTLNSDVYKLLYLCSHDTVGWLCEPRPATVALSQHVYEKTRMLVHVVHVSNMKVGVVSNWDDPHINMPSISREIQKNLQSLQLPRYQK